MTVELTFQVSVVLLRGAALMSPRFSVGKYRLANDPPGTLRFACLDIHGAVVTAREEWRESESRVDVDRSGWSADFQCVERHDWTAFGAARAFVAAAGERAVQIALRALKKAEASGETRGVDPGPPYSTPRRLTLEEVSARARPGRQGIGRPL